MSKQKNDKMEETPIDKPVEKLEIKPVQNEKMSS